MIVRTARTLILVIFTLTCATGTAQLAPAAQDALDSARENAARAESQGVAAYPDAPLWLDALRQGELAARLAPGAPEPLLFLAETYTATRWYARAWEAWRQYAEVVGTLDAPTLASATDVGTTLAYLRYQEGDTARATARYQEVIALNPADAEAFTWMGRILLETGRPDEAIPYWERVVELEPDNAAASYFLALARDEVRFGTPGVESFYEGIRLYEAGDVAAALEHFQMAAEANPAYKEAFVWVGRSALELGRPGVAQAAWRRVVNLDPGDERASYFLVLAQDQRLWGVAAVTAFREGVTLYEQGDVVGAQASFVLATEANQKYAAAWAWLGRTGFEQGDYQAAFEAYDRAVQLEPENRLSAPLNCVFGN